MSFRMLGLRIVTHISLERKKFRKAAAVNIRYSVTILWNLLGQTFVMVANCQHVYQQENTCDEKVGIGEAVSLTKQIVTITNSETATSSDIQCKNPRDEIVRCEKNAQQRALCRNRLLTRWKTAIMSPNCFRRQSDA